MQDFPPSYELATTRDVWTIVADYIPSADLCAASLVCKRWHKVFVPFLWGAPASHFGTDNDAVYVALTRFRRTLKRARLDVRMLTHTFHLPPALSEIYGGPRRSWLQEVLQYLPNLQSLLVSQLPFFDHNSLIALRPKSNDDTAYEAYGLRLLVAQREPNTTSLGVREALLRFPLLVYLDLSFTTPAKDHGVLSAITYLRHLQVLKLRGIGLRDADLEVAADSIKTRVRLLDVRNNMLTDASLRPLLQKCFLPLDVDVSSPTDREVKFHFEWACSISPFANILGADSLKSEDFDTHLMKQLMIPLTGRSDPQDLPHVGITHLYISDNRLSVEGLGSLLKSTRLHVLDGGTVKSAGSMWKRKGFEPITDNESQWVVGVRYPGAEKLIPALRHSAAEKLTYLRIHHAVVTENASTSSSEIFPTRRTPKRRPVPPAATMELDGFYSQIYELPADAEPVRYELADTSFQRPMPGWKHKLRSSSDARSPTSSHCLPLTHPQAPPLSQFLSAQPRSDLIQSLLKKRPEISHGIAPFYHPSHTPHLRTLVLTDVPASVPPSSHIISFLTRFITSCADEAYLATLQARSDYSLPPGRLRASAERQHVRSFFSLERIILEITPVAKPDSSKDSTSWNRSGAGFFSKSSTEDIDSENLWAAAENDFSFFSREIEEECGVRDEEAKDTDSDREGEKDAVSVHSRRIPELEATTAPLSHLASAAPQLPPPELPLFSPPNQTPLASPSPSPSPNGQKRQHTNQATSPKDAEIDVVAALAAFRKIKKAEYEELLSRTNKGVRKYTNTSTPVLTPMPTPTSPRSQQSSASSSSSSSSSLSASLNYPLYVEGHWKGEVKIVRNPTPKGRSGGFVDIYGNYFERGYLYP
ncbi:leucine rich repeat domain-containing protein [Histoplasma capsulatum var. duboisii H88]|uniref:Leucine rich repeat domain-containing protein n=2 Tax=Ajellomyces capsulatus TaxID=5037 RepID=F0U5W3_AJEC8|nr:leucine rich repeat domain-containing protein [Histoplasma capsulatum var. duboisii H88]QSS51385.1 leucine rich repeat domain-containing protein [Histoplasma capsulatum var. duboisii H88]